MRRIILPAAAILLTAACSSTTDHAAPEATVHLPMQSAPAASGSTTANAKPSQRAEPSCSPTRDVIVWTKAPGVSNSAQVVGNYNLATCETTFQWLQKTSPTGPGDCTEAAWASDNPGYNADATPAARPKNVQVAIGPAC